MRVNNYKTNKKIQEEKNVYWNKEYQANSTRKVDISGLEYIAIPLNLLPFAETSDEELLSIQKTINNLAQQKILNLTGISNTDLKLKYGVANITSLSEFDSNYTLLIHTLYKWGEYLYNHNQISDAVKVLEFGIKCNTDISKNYILLATIYKDTNVANKIDDLLCEAEKLSTLMKDSIINSLKEIKLSSYIE